MERTNKQSGELLKWLFDFRQLNKQQKFDTVTTTKSSVTEFCELTFISKLFFFTILSRHRLRTQNPISYQSASYMPS